MPLILPGNVGSATAATGYDVANSIRLNSGDSAVLKRTHGTPTSAKKFVWSAWIKRSKLGADQYFVQNYTDSSNVSMAYFRSGDDIRIFDRHGTGDGTDTVWISDAKFRDVSAWMHFLLKVDTTQSTDSNRFQVYINGSLATGNGITYPAQNADMNWTSASASNRHSIGATSDGYNYVGGYMCEVVLVDGTSPAHTDFGEFNSDSPTIWQPKDVSGLTFGNNGYYLDFEDSGDLGDDESGNGNDFAETNLAAIDQTVDTCTNNFCTVNSLDNYHQQATYSEGNTKITFKGPSSYYAYSTGTFGMASGKWYWETKATSAGNHNVYGISGRYVIAYNKGLGVNTDEYGYYNYNGNYTNASSDGSYREVSFSGGNVTWTTNDIIGIALDLDSSTNTVKFYKNNALIGTVDVIAPSSGFYYPAWNQFDNQAEVCQPNFGNPSYTLSSAQADANGYGAFEYAPPSGYYALCSKNLAEFG